MSNKSNVNTRELKEFLTYVIENNRHLQKDGKIPVAVNVEGESGLGKTSVILQLADQLKMQCVKISLSQLEEIGDLTGFPLKEHKVIRKETGKDDEERWIPESVMGKYIEQRFVPNGEVRTSHAPPSWIQGRKEGGILILDDYTRANTMFMQATMELIDRQTYAGWSLPADWHIVLTTNPDDGEYIVTTLDAAQKTRFITANLKFDLKCWAKWAESEGIDGRGINFMLMHPELSEGKEKGFNSRSVTTFFNSISSIPDFEEGLPMIQMIGEGSVGPEFATLFGMFINNKLDKLITPEDIVTKPWPGIKDRMMEAIGRDTKYRADIAGTLTTRIINYLLSHASKHSKVDDKIIERIETLATEKDDILTNDLRYYLVRALHAGERAKFQKILNIPKLNAMLVK